MFQSGFDAVFTLHLVARIDKRNLMSKTYHVHILYGLFRIEEISSHFLGQGVKSIKRPTYDNKDRTISIEVDTNNGKSTTVYWSVYGLGHRDQGTFDVIDIK